jgi:hypothetical protein
MSHGSRPASYISRRCSNFKLVWVCTRRSTSFWPSLFLLFELIQPSIDQLCSHADTEQGSSTTLRVSQIRAGQGSTNVLIQTCMSDFMQSAWKAPVKHSVFQSAFFKRVCFFWREKKVVLASGRECHTEGWKRDEKGPKKKIQFFFTTRALVQWIHCTSQWTRTVHVHLWTASLLLEMCLTRLIYLMCHGKREGGPGERKKERTSEGASEWVLNEWVSEWVVNEWLTYIGTDRTYQLVTRQLIMLYSLLASWTTLIF